MARINFGAKPLSYPQPVLIIAAYDGDGRANAMNAAWGGITGSDELTICVSPGHKTVKDLRQTGDFTVSMGDAAHVTACDYLGIASGNTTEDKLARAGFTVTKSRFVNAPVINELAVCLECRVVNYDEASHRLVGRIVNVSVDDSVVTDGRVDTDKVRPISFDPFNNTYRVLGEKAGYAFSDGKALQ